MATLTPIYEFQLPTVGGDLNVWGGYLNDNFELLDDLLGGVTPLDGVSIINGDGEFTTLAATDFTSVLKISNATPRLELYDTDVLTTAAISSNNAGSLRIRADIGSLAASSEVTFEVDDIEVLAAYADRLEFQGAPYYSREGDKVINGAFDFWQRGTSHSTGGYGSADRWFNGFSGGTCTMARQGFNLGTMFGKNTPKYFLRETVSGQSLASHYCAVVQRIEGVDTYQNEAITVMGWVRRNTGAGNIALSLAQNFGTGGSPSATVASAGQQVTLTADWEPFAVTFTVPSINGKTLGSNNDDYLELDIWLSAGTDFASQAASLGVQTISADFWGVHIRKGTVPVEAVNQYIAPPIDETIHKCQRYYCRFPVNVRFFPVNAGTVHTVPLFFPVRMRATPTVSAAVAGSRVNLTSLTYNAYSSPDGAAVQLIAAVLSDTYVLNDVAQATAEL